MPEHFRVHSISGSNRELVAAICIAADYIDQGKKALVRTNREGNVLVLNLVPEAASEEQVYAEATVTVRIIGESATLELRGINRRVESSPGARAICAAFGALAETDDLDTDAMVIWIQDRGLFFVHYMELPMRLGGGREVQLDADYQVREIYRGY